MTRKTAQPGQTTEGRIFYATADTVTVSDGKSLIVYDRKDFLPDLPRNGEAVQVQSRGELGQQREPERRLELRPVEAERPEPPASEQTRSKNRDDYER